MSAVIDKVQDKIIFYGNRQAGEVALAALTNENYNIVEIWHDGYSQGQVLDDNYSFTDADILVCVHGRKIIPEDVLNKFRYAINLHPFLDKYPGADPVGRAIESGESIASVFAHKMTGEVDSGEVLAARYTDMPENPTVDSVYEALYPLYAEVVMEGVKACLFSDR